MATTDQGFEMDESTTGGLDALELPELSETVWMRLLANALDPDAPPADPGLIPVDGPGTPSDPGSVDVTDPEHAVVAHEDGVADEGADGDAAGAGQFDDGGAALLPHSDPAVDAPVDDLGLGLPGDAPGGQWTDPNDHSPF